MDKEIIDGQIEKFEQEILVLENCIATLKVERAKINSPQMSSSEIVSSSSKESASGDTNEQQIKDELYKGVKEDKGGASE